MATLQIANEAEFFAEIDAFVDKLVPEEVVATQTVVALEALKRVIQKTPVDTGRARGNWQTTIERPARGETKTLDTSGAQSISAGTATIAKLKPYQVIWFTNNVPYILVLENGLFNPPDPGPSKDRRPHRKGRILVRGGYSIQAPQGMVKVTIQELKQGFPGLREVGDGPS